MVGPRALLLLSVLLLVPSASAISWSDTADDHQAGPYPGHWDDEPVQWMDASTLGWFPYLDVLEAGIDETDSDLRFFVKVATDQPGADDPDAFTYVYYRFYFTFHGEERAAQFVHYLDGSMSFFVVGRPFDFSTNWIRTEYFAFAEPLADGTGWQATIPKRDLRDGDLVPARAGDVLGDIRFNASGARNSYSSPCVPVYVASEQSVDKCWKARDLITGEGSTDGGLGDYTIATNPKGQGHLLWVVERPFRASNGLATTYLFELTLRNLDPEPDTALLQIGNRSEDWTVHLPRLVELPGESAVTVPVAVSVPFEHGHGQAKLMDIRAVSDRQPGIEAVTQVGVIWNEVPQPGGHHPTLYLHADQQANGWMNTMQSDPNGGAPAITHNGYSYNNGLEADSWEARYRIWLNPPLQIGLDFDLQRQLSFQYAIQSNEAIAGAEVTTRVVVTGDPEVVVAQETRTVDLEQGETPIGASLDVAEEADRIPREGNGQLVFQITIAATEPKDPVAQATEFVAPGQLELPAIATQDSFLSLPLFDYHDIIDEGILGSLAQLSLTAQGPTHKGLNPGKTAAFAFTVANHAKGDEPVAWRIVGDAADWAKVTPAESRIPGNGNGTVAVRVTAPADAVEGDEADLLLVGQSTDNANVQVFAHLIAVVVTSEDIPDEAEDAASLEKEARKTADKGIPLPFGVVVAAVALALLRRRS